MKIVRRLKARIRKWRSDRFLKKHYCTSYREYNQTYDPGINIKAAYIHNFYSKSVYPYVYQISDPKHRIYYTETDGFHWNHVGFYEVRDWCEKNCKGKFRFDHHLVRHSDGMISYGYSVNYDNVSTYFVAFNDEMDYTWFLLRWS